MANEDKIRGRGQELKGDVKQTAGDALGNDDLRREGAADKAKGKVNQVKGDVKDAVNDLKR